MSAIHYDLLELMSQEMIKEIDRQIMEELWDSVRGWFYARPEYVYPSQSAIYYGTGVE